MSAVQGRNKLAQQLSTNVSGQFQKQMTALPADEDVFHIGTHGGLGDIVWLYKKLCNLPQRLFISVANENRHRPRRSGYLLDHMPRVAGWTWSDSTFAPGGQDWPDNSDPCCAINKTWEELDFKLNTPVPHRLECNRWLEGGRRIEGWLPDVPTTHHFEFAPCGPSQLVIKKPYILLHIAGWGDVPDASWRTIARLFAGTCHVYIVGGSYDFRPANVYKGMDRSHVTLLEDLTWDDLYHLINGCDYCFGHASGFTALCDVLKKRGAIFNPRSVPGLINTWNSLQNADMIYVDKVEQFESAAYAAYKSMSGGSATWPPAGGVRGRGIIVADTSAASSPITSVADFVSPRNIAIMSLADEQPDYLASAAIGGAYDSGSVVESVMLLGCDAGVLAGAYRETARSSRKAAIEASHNAADFRPRFAGIDLGIVYTGTEPSAALTAAQKLWGALTMRGTLLIGGRVAETVARSMGSALRVEPGIVTNTTAEWYFLHKRK